METTEVTLTVEQVPLHYMRCFQSDCPKSAECMHYLASQYIADEVDKGEAVYPTARKNGDCRWFKQKRVVSMAWGFSKLFSNVKQQDYLPMRQAFTIYLGSRMTYSRYHRGLFKLTPEQQQWVAQMFRQYGYTDEPVYDNCTYEFDFTDTFRRQ